MTFTLGKRLQMHVFGESHGKCVGVVVEGCPPGLELSEGDVQPFLDKRKPGQNALVSARKEGDKCEILSGVFNGKTTGAPIAMLIKNEDVDSSYYENIKDNPRPGHADVTARIKYKGFNDYRGGGVFSGRMTAAFVMAGAIANKVLMEKGVKVEAGLVQVGTEKKEFTREIMKARETGDSIGGLIECKATGVKADVGEPLFDSLESMLAHAMFSIPAVKGVEFGSGFKCVEMRGSEHNALPSGGALGGISDGTPIMFRVAVKPTSSVIGSVASIKRHDPCIAVRAVPVVEAMAAFVIADLLLFEGE